MAGGGNGANRGDRRIRRLAYGLSRLGRGVTCSVAGRGRRGGSQAYLGPRALCRARRHDDRLGVLPPAGDAAAQSIQAVRLALRGRTVAADSGLAGAGRGYAPSGEFGSGSLTWPAVPRVATGGRGSGGRQRVVAELGQDVAGLPEDLAGLGQRGALAVLAVLDRGVVAVVGGRGAGVGL